MATNTLSNRGYRSSMRPEQLEGRVMLSASPSNLDHDLTLAQEVRAFKDAWNDGAIDLQITGTEVQFSPLGLPEYMAGTVSYVMANGSSLEGAGVYQETLTPIFMDSDGDSVPDMFVGTNGVATFSFYAGKARDILIGTITTVNTSYIQGVTALGELLVASTGTISASSGLFKELSGSFTSQSSVGLYPSFTMNTTVQFTIDSYQFDGHFAGQLAKSIASSLAETHEPKLKASAVDAFHASNDDDGPGKDHKHQKHGMSHVGDHSVSRVDLVAKSQSHDGDSGRARRHDRWAAELAGLHHGVA